MSSVAASGVKFDVGRSSFSSEGVRMGPGRPRLRRKNNLVILGASQKFFYALSIEN